TTVDSHVDHLATNFWGAAPVLVLQEKDPPYALLVLTLITLSSVGLFACLDHLRTMTVGTLHHDIDHRHPPRPVIRRDDHTRKLLFCNVTHCEGNRSVTGSQSCPLVSRGSLSYLAFRYCYSIAKFDKKERLFYGRPGTLRGLDPAAYSSSCCAG